MAERKMTREQFDDLQKHLAVISGRLQEKKQESKDVIDSYRKAYQNRGEDPTVYYKEADRCIRENFLALMLMESYSVGMEMIFGVRDYDLDLVKEGHTFNEEDFVRYGKQ